MPAATPIQKAAFDAIDNLHFNQVLMHLICSGKSGTDKYHLKIIKKINKILSDSGMSGKEAEIAKHYLLSYLEIYLSVDMQVFLDASEHIEIEKYGVNRFSDNRMNYEKYIDVTQYKSLDMLLDIANYNGVDRGFMLRTARVLIFDRELSLSTIPYFVKYRLAECCYALEYPDAPLGFYRELVNLGVISCEKYSCNKELCKKDLYKKESCNVDFIVKAVGSDVSLQFIRAGLIFELKMLQGSQSIMISRNKYDAIFLPPLDPETSRTKRKDIAAHYKKMVDFWLLKENKSSTGVFQCKGPVSKETVENLLKQMTVFYFHKRMFDGTQGSWLGTLGAFYIEKCIEKKTGEAIYYAESKKTTISEKIKSKLISFGFKVSARNLYLRHKNIKRDDYSKIRYYISLFFEKGASVVPWHFNNNSYYEMALEYEEKNKRGTVH
ncbi:hypothetical protein [Citrobacter portucalensis]|uniref:hypothetical protein n=1 Tax=Citrobacter portucalensis TaxID=1639133 RepID=UPI0023B28D22|nr:hypothetical protein [Citrobacter portucalensis]MDE9690220.1 hypothetical protein [Citrobacter portucalensis]WOU50934.1 hypothetical protein R4T22_06760 [Citrobacter portucalensis]